MKEQSTVSDRSNEPWAAEVRARLQARGKQRPGTKARQILALWPEIRAVLAGGQTLKTVRDWLNEEGVAVTYGALTSYVSRIRRRERALSEMSSHGSAAELSLLAVTQDQRAIANTVTASPHESADPLQNVRERSANRPGFEYPPGVDEESLI